MNGYINVLDNCVAGEDAAIEKMTEEDVFGQSFAEYIENVNECSLDDIHLDVNDIDTSVFIIDDGGELFRTKSGDYINVCWRGDSCRVWIEEDPEIISIYNSKLKNVVSEDLDDVEDYNFDNTEEDSWYKGIDDEGDQDFVEDEIEEDYSDDYKNERYQRLVGKKIRILHMDDPYAGKDYDGREGVIEYVATDPFGDVYFDGTWGSLSVYPKVDSFEYVDEFDIDDAAKKLVAMANKDGRKLSFEDAKEVLDQSFNQKVDTLDDFYNRLNFDEYDNVSEGLFDAEKETTNYGHKAWVLNQIISSMNDETAYYDTEWLYIWPDGETEKECDDDFGDEESFKDLEDTFISIYTYNSAVEEFGEGADKDPKCLEECEYNFHRDGLYNPTKEAVELAHEYDKKLGLEPIKVLGNVKECVDDVRFAESVEEVKDKNNYEVKYEDCDFGRTEGEYYFSTNISQNDNEDDDLQITIECETDKDCINCYYDEIEKFQGYSYGENVVELDPNDVETKVIYSTWDDFSKQFTKDEVVNVYGISAEDLDALTQKARNEAVDTFINDVIEYYSENMDEIIPEDDGPDPDYEYERYRDMRDEY